MENEHGIFTDNELTGQTAEEVYQEWFINKDNPTEPQPNKIDICLTPVEQAIATLAMQVAKNTLLTGGN